MIANVANNRVLFASHYPQMHIARDSAHACAGTRENSPNPGIIMKVLGYDSEIGAYTPSAVLIMGKTIPEKRIWVWFGYDSDHLLAINSTQQQSRPIPEKQNIPVFTGFSLKCLVAKAGIEPATHGFSVRCSTN